MLLHLRLALSCLVLSIPAFGATINIGAISFNEFVPNIPGVPGINSFDIQNLTGTFSLPPDFPVSDALIFQSGSFQLFQGSTLWGTFTLGNIGPGPLLDLSGSPFVQVPGDLLFTSARFLATLSSPTFTVDGGGVLVANSLSIDALFLPGSGPNLIAGVDSALISINANPPSAVPEASSGWLLLIGIGSFAAWRWRKKAAAVVVPVVIAAAIALPAAAQNITLSGTTSPAAGQPGVTTMTVTGSGFPAGTLAANQVVVTLSPVASGPVFTAVPTAVATVAGTTRRVTFSFTGTNVATPLNYNLAVSGPGFQSTNRAVMIVNPPAAATISPASANPGASFTAAIAGTYTNFLNGSTRANFGPGISVGGAPAGEYGRITVTSATAATAQIALAQGVAIGARGITIATGVQQASANFIVNAPGNAVPTITSSAVTTGTLLQSYTYNVTASDTDNDPIGFSLTTFPLGMTINSSTGVISWTPPGTGNLNVTVQASDGRGGVASQSFVVNVAGIPNGPPVLSALANRTVNIGDTLGLQLVASDPNPNDALQYSLPVAPAGAALSPSPVVKWTPGPQHIGPPQPFTARVQDPLGLNDSKSFIVTVTNNNVAPVFNPQADGFGSAGTAFSRVLSATDPNPGDTLRFSLLSGPAGLTVATNGQLTWIPIVNQYGSNVVKVQVADAAGLIDAGTFRIDVGVSLPNYPPVAVDDRYSVRRGTTLNVPSLGVLANDSDPEGNPLTARLIAPPSRGTASLAANGGFSYTPTPPPLNSTEPKLKYAFTAPLRSSTNTTPVVVDLDKDGVPDIVFLSSGTFLTRTLYAINGSTGAVKWSVNGYDPANGVELSLSNETLVAGDIDGDGFPEILVVSDQTTNGGTQARRRIFAYNYNGTLKWISNDIVDGVRVTESSGPRRLVLANVTGDGKPEIVFTHTGRTNDMIPGSFPENLVSIYNHLGQPLTTTRLGRFGGGGSTTAGITLAVADLDLDGKSEILVGDAAVNGQGTLLWQSAAADGVNDIAVANLDDDPFPELVYLDRFARLYCVEHTGALKWGPITVPPTSTSSNPGFIVIGDVDGNGTVEILIARENKLFVYGANGALQRTILLPFDGEGGNATIFDLNGDGKPEIIYHSTRGPFDSGFTQGALMILDGATGTVLHTIKASRSSNAPFDTATPIVADVDGDGSAKIVVGGWDDPTGLLRVFEANIGHWAPARPVANQQEYSVTNVNADGTIPASPAPNWLTPGLNNYRVYSSPPAERTSELDQFTYAANDGLLDSNIATVKVDILPQNNAPRIVSTAPATASPNIEYLYAIRAVDPDPGEILTFSLAKAAAGMTIGANTGVVRWTPTNAQLGSQIIALKVTDSQGLTDYEGYTLTVGAPVVVPNVVAFTEAAARSTLASVGLLAGTITTAPSGSRPAGQVISHEPGSGASVPSGSLVNLVISSGPSAVPVPAVVGKKEGSALTLLTQAGFAANITRVFSNTISFGTIISQNPAANTLLVPGSVAITISAGSGLSLRLATNIVTADKNISFLILASDLNGIELPAPPVSYTVAANPAPFTGGLPTVDTANRKILPALSTRGGFRITATDTATGRTAFADFGVTFPRALSTKPSMTDAFVELTSALSDIDELIRQARLARIANNIPQMNSLLRAMVTRWRQVDRKNLRYAVPVALESGFPSTAADLPALGLTLTADDKLALSVLNDSIADLKALREALRPPGVQTVVLKGLFDRFNSRAARIRGLTISVAGAIRLQGQYAVITSQLIPDVYDGLMNAIGIASGVPAVPLSIGVPRNTKAAKLAKSATVLPRDSTLAEELTTLIVDTIVEKIQESLEETVMQAKTFVTQILVQGAWAAGAVVAAQAVRQFVHGQELAGVVSGASLSFRTFEAGFAMIEGTVETENPELNTLVMIGPDILAPSSAFIEKFKHSMKYRQILNPLANDGKYKNSSEIWDDLKDFRKALLSLTAATIDVVNAINNAFQPPPPGGADRGCILSNAPDCGELHFPGGFDPVYTYSPPPGFSSFSGLPAPIITIVYNHVNGTMYFDTPVFVPLKP